MVGQDAWNKRLAEAINYTRAQGKRTWCVRVTQVSVRRCIVACRDGTLCMVASWRSGRVPLPKERVSYMIPCEEKQVALVRPSAGRVDAGGVLKRLPF